MATLIVLGGGLIKDQATGQWRTCGPTEGDEYGCTWDRLRVEAARVLWEKGLYSNFVASGGAGQIAHLNDPTIPKVGEIIKTELVACGVPREQIIEEIESNTTAQQLRLLCRLIENGAVGPACGILSQEYHVGRIWAMIQYNQDFRKILHRAQFLEAEGVLIEQEPDRWKSRIESMRQHPDMVARIMKEYRGIRDLALGKYRF